MIQVKKKYECKLNSETEKNIEFWVNVIDGTIKDEGSVVDAKRQLRNYIGKLVMTSFNKGMAEGEKEKGR